MSDTNFINRVSMNDAVSTSLLTMGINLSSEDKARLARYERNWNFYEGYHWEEIPDTGTDEVTQNYCRAFVNKFVAFELGKGFNIRMKPDIEPKLLPFLNEVWEDNDKDSFCQLFGQSKSVTGDTWVQVGYQPKYDDTGVLYPNFYDPYDEYEKGRIHINVIPPSIAFPEYHPLNKELLVKFTLMYPKRNNDMKFEVYSQEWTRERVVVRLGEEVLGDFENKYGVIPFFHCKNFPQVGKTEGVSDLEDVIPLNMELNLKSSNVSEIIDYHSAPVTVVYGARIGQLEKGANKVWGGLPTDAKVENLELQGDLRASQDYMATIKKAMHEVGNLPEGALGAQQAISNTSGVALQITLLPLLDRTQIKRALSTKCLRDINKFIIKIGLTEGLLDDVADLDKWKKGDKYSKDIYHTEIVYEENLPKDKLVQLQQIQLEMKMGTMNRPQAMKELGKENIEETIKEITKDRKDNPDLYGIEVDKNTGEILTGRLDPNAQNQIGVGGSISGQSSTGFGRVKDVMKRGLGVNKDGTDVEVNAGFQNSPMKKDPQLTAKGKQKSK